MSSPPHDDEEQQSLLRKQSNPASADKVKSNPPPFTFPDLPEKEEKLRLRKLNLSALENIVIPIFYFALGFGQKVTFVASRQYLRRVLNLSPANQGLILDVIVQIPWSLKLFYAFASDTLPINGQRRKPYMFIGVTCCTLAWMLLGVIHPSPNTSLTCVLMFLATFGLLMSDVMADALVVEKVALEKGQEIGTTQTTVWGLRFGGSFVGMLLGGVLLEFAHFTEQHIFLLQGVTHGLFLLFPLFLLRDDRVVQLPASPTDPATNGATNSANSAASAGRTTIVTNTTEETTVVNGIVVDSTRIASTTVVDATSVVGTLSVGNQLRAIWGTIQDQRVYSLVYFMFVVGSMPNAGSSFTNYLLGPLKFTDLEYMVVGLVGIVCSTIGIFMYKWWFRNVDLRWFVGIASAIVAVLSLIPLILVFRINQKWGISDLAFSLGDEALVEIIGMLTTMPILIVCAKLAPKGIEACVYSFLTMATNISFTIGNSFSNIIAAKVGITQTNFDALWCLIVMSAVCTCVPVGFVWLLPAAIEKTTQVDLTTKKGKSALGGACAVALVLGGLCYATVHSIVKVSTDNT